MIQPSSDRSLLRISYLKLSRYLLIQQLIITGIRQIILHLPLKEILPGFSKSLRIRKLFPVFLYAVFTEGLLVYRQILRPDGIRIPAL